MSNPHLIQRVEGLALFLAGIAAFVWSGRSWWLFALLLLAPDVSMIGYLRGPRVGAALYNLFHTLVWPVLLLGLSVTTGPYGLAGIGAIWLCHIGMDRALGYGLKLVDGFAHTHLGVIGRGSSWLGCD